MDPVQKASEYYGVVRDQVVSPDICPSELWLQHIRVVLDEAMTSLSSAADVVRSVTENNLFTYPRRATDPEFPRMIHNFSQQLARMGLPLDSLDSLLQESHLVSPLVTTALDGRVVSTVFLYHLSVSWRVMSCLGRRRSPCAVLELGGGFGGLARATKLLAPHVQYFIVDLPESLWFSYTYLSANFPEAKILFCTRPDEDVLDDYDFVLVPLSLIPLVHGRRFDAVINTASLGEMTDAAAARYMRFVQEDIETAFFYSLNRFGQHLRNERYRGERLDLPDCAKVAVNLDPFWRVHLWNIVGDDSFSLFETHNPPQLELLVERVPQALLCEDYRRALSQRLLDEACLMPEQNHRWQYLMWESIRLFTTDANLDVYLEFLHRHGHVEFEHYQRVRADLERSRAASNA